MSKIEKLIDWQDLQYTVSELCEYLAENIAPRKDVTSAIFIYRDKDGLYFVLGSNNREYSLSEVNWDMDQIKVSMLQDDLI